jgi:hypothetical protein
MQRRSRGNGPNAGLHAAKVKAQCRGDSAFATPIDCDQGLLETKKRKLLGDENLKAKLQGGDGPVKGGTLCKGRSYAKFSVERSKAVGAIVARIALLIVRLGCACQGCPQHR